MFNTVNSKMFAPVDKNNNEPVMLVVGSGSSMSAVASKLQKMGLINSKWGIKLLADFTNRSGKVKAGEYILDRTMSANEILEILTQPSPVRLTVTVTITEGMNLESIAKLLQEKEVIENAQSFLEQCNDLTAFESFSFVSGLKNRQSVRYQLEGYLFPDTYEFFVDEDPTHALSRLLDNFNTKMSDELMQKVEASGYSLNQILTIASLIEKETDGTDRENIASVIYNRLNNIGETYHKLQIDASLIYGLGDNYTGTLTSSDLNYNTPYNLSMYEGLSLIHI